MAHDGALPNPSQSKKILAWLVSGKTLTQAQALKMFGCARLAARIRDLIEAGHPIHSELITVKNRGGETCRVAEYSMIKPSVVLPGQLDMREVWGDEK